MSGREFLSAQRGFSLIEVSIVTAIMLLLAIIGIPAIGTYVIENKVPKVGEELQRFITRVKVNAQGAGPQPYASVSTATLANALRDSSVLSVAGEETQAVVAHGLGGLGSSGNGEIRVAPAAIDGAAPGSAFSIRLAQVSHAACPAIASVMQRMADVIEVTGRNGAVRVKDAGATPALHYDAARAEAQCKTGSVNTFMFVIR